MFPEQEHIANTPTIDQTLVAWVHNCLKSLEDKALRIQNDPNNFIEKQIIELAAEKLKHILEHPEENLIKPETLLKHLDQKIQSYTNKLHTEETADKDWGHKPDEHIRYELQQQAWLRLRSELFPHYPEADIPLKL